MRKRIEIVAFERERVLCHSVVTCCPVCRSRSELLTLDQAAALLGFTAGRLALLSRDREGAVAPTRRNTPCI